jgi:hypothetical protein
MFDTPRTGVGRRAALALCCASALPRGQAARADPASAPAHGALEARYWDWGATPKRDDYQFALLRLALDKTVKDFGPYQLKRVVRSYATPRLRREIHIGQVVNVHAGPWRPLETSEDKLAERSLRVNVSILQDLLGYRRLLIRREDVDRFRHIRDAQDLKKLVIGQANGWVDVDIYRHNGYRVNDTPTPATLFDMLANKRFDYIPISLMDVDTVLATRPEVADRLVVLRDITLFFPLPVIFYVSPQEPRLAQRLEAGLQLARHDGSLDRLFKGSFAREFQLLREGSARRFVLANPFVPKELAAQTSLDPVEGASASARASRR